METDRRLARSRTIFGAGIALCLLTVMFWSVAFPVDALAPGQPYYVVGHTYASDGVTVMTGCDVTVTGFTDASGAITQYVYTTMSDEAGSYSVDANQGGLCANYQWIQVKATKGGFSGGSALNYIGTSPNLVVDVNLQWKGPVLDPIGDKTAGEGSLLTFTATATDPDLPGDTLIFSLANGASGGVPIGASITSAGVFTWTPTEDQGPGSYTFDVVVSDASALTDSETITVTIVEEMQVISPNGGEIFAVGSTCQITWSWAGGTGNVVIFLHNYGVEHSTSTVIEYSYPNMGRYLWHIPSDLQLGSMYMIRVQSYDYLSFQDSSDSYFTVVGAIQLLDPNGGEALQTGSTYPITWSWASGIGNVNIYLIDYSTTPMPPLSTLIAGNVPNSGRYDWTIPSDLSPGTAYRITVSGVDVQTGDSSDNYFSILATPILNSIGDKIVDEEILLSFIATASDADIPAQILTFSLADGISGDVPDGASIDPLTGAFTWIPTEAQGPGDYTFDVVVSDGALTDSETITVTVNEANVAPVLDPLGDKTVDEGIFLTFTATATDHDIPAQTLTFSLADGPSGSVPIGASITSTGFFAWAPDESQGPAVYTLDVVVSDGALSDSETIRVIVNEVTPGNVAPSLEIVVDSGPVCFPGEIGEFYALVSYQGAAVVPASISATLYGVAEPLVLVPEEIAIGLYVMQYQIPADAGPGTYALAVEASYMAGSDLVSATGLSCIQISQTLTQWNAWLQLIQGDVGTVVTDLGPIQLALSAIDTDVGSIQGNIVTIKSSIGTIQTDLTTIGAALVSIDGGVVTIGTRLGTVETSISSIATSVAYVDGRLVTLETSLGDIVVDVSSIALDVVSLKDGQLTIETQLGNIAVDISTIGGVVASIDGTLATIETDIETFVVDVSSINAQLLSIDGRTATIQTDLGIVKTDVAWIKAGMIQVWGNKIKITTTVGEIIVDASSVDTDYIPWLVEPKKGVDPAMYVGMAILAMSLFAAGAMTRSTVKPGNRASRRRSKQGDAEKPH